MRSEQVAYRTANALGVHGFTMSIDRSCSLADCAKPSAVTLESYEYCVAHFIRTCYQRLEKSPEKLRKGDQENEGLAEAQKRSLLEIVDRATALSLTNDDLSNQERSQLLDILLWAGNLIRQV